MCDHEHEWEPSSTWVWVGVNLDWIKDYVEPKPTILELEECAVCNVARIPERATDLNSAHLLIENGKLTVTPIPRGLRVVPDPSEETDPS